VKPSIVSAEDLGLAPEELQPKVTFTRQFVPTIQGNCEFISGETAAETADRLIARLRAESVIQ
jgi:electron transfer flavoprotein beta subunit